MKKEKTVRAYQRRTKSGKVVTVRQHTAKYDAAEDLAKKKGAGDELMEKRESLVKEAEPAKEDDLGFTAEEFKEWYHGTGSDADMKVAEALRVKLGKKGYRKFEDEAIDNYTPRGHTKMLKSLKSDEYTKKGTRGPKSWSDNVYVYGRANKQQNYLVSVMDELDLSHPKMKKFEKYLDKRRKDGHSMGDTYDSFDKQAWEKAAEIFGMPNKIPAHIKDDPAYLRKKKTDSRSGHTVKKLNDSDVSPKVSSDLSKSEKKELSGKKSTGKINIKTTMPKTFKTPIDWTIDYDHSGWDGHKSYSKRIKARSEKEAERIYKQMYHIKGETTLNAIRPSKSYDNMDSFKTLGLDFNEIMKRYW